MTVLLTKREAAARLRVSVRSLDRLRSQGQIRTVRVRGVVRITESDIERFVAEHTKGGAK
jgi:excisionase family DNA binding protein